LELFREILPFVSQITALVEELGAEQEKLLGQLSVSISLITVDP
jgi:hypothetical protein